jgi:hypothetical protein
MSFWQVTGTAQPDSVRGARARPDATVSVAMQTVRETVTASRINLNLFGSQGLTLLSFTSSRLVHPAPLSGCGPVP